MLDSLVVEEVITEVYDTVPTRRLVRALQIAIGAQCSNKEEAVIFITKKIREEG